MEYIDSSRIPKQNAMLRSWRSLKAFFSAVPNIGEARLIQALANMRAEENARHLKDIIQVLLDIKRMGCLSTMDYLRLCNHGFNPLLFVQHATKKSMRDLYLEMKLGLISAQQVEEAFWFEISEEGRLFFLAFPPC